MKTAAALAPEVSPLRAAPKPPSLISPAIDVLMIGGASLVLFTLAYLLVDKKGSTNQVSWAAFYLAMAINNPHFMASYLLLYWDKRKELLKRPKFLWAGIVAPALTIAYLAGCIAMESPRYLSYAVNAMFFLVGWHYVKQIYGTIVVTSARRGYYFSKQEGWALKLNLYPVWFMSYINGNSSVRELMHYGIGYKTFDVPTAFKYLNFAFLAVSLAGLTYVLFRKWVREGKLPGWPAVASFAAIYIWYLPSLYHAIFWYMIPFFHSLQYMLFVTALKKNQFAAESAVAFAEPAERRMAFARQALGFTVAIVVLGMAVFHWLPNTMDNYLAYDDKVFGQELFMFCFITFINIHHYFIDNVIWRRDNPAMKYL